MFKIFPVKDNKIVLISFYNKYCLDIKAIGNYIISNNHNEFNVFIGIIGKSNLSIDGIEKINIRNIIGIYHLMTAKTIIYSINCPNYIPYRKKQILINTWHGNGIKKLYKKLNSNYFKNTTCFTSYSKKYTEIKLKNSFNYYGEILPIGAPKNDIFFSKNKCEIIKNIKEKLGLTDKKIALYAPTFRNLFEETKDSLDFIRLKENLEKKFGNEWVVLYRVHPSLVDKYKTETNVIDVSTYNDMQELLLISDILITDYSSSVWDFGLQRKPILIYAPDIDEYQKNDRGFIIPINKWPYPIAKSDDELENNINKFNIDDFRIKLDKYYEESGSYEEGTACKNLIKYILDKIKGEL